MVVLWFFWGCIGVSTCGIILFCLTEAAKSASKKREGRQKKEAEKERIAERTRQARLLQLQYENSEFLKQILKIIEEKSESNLPGSFYTLRQDCIHMSTKGRCVGTFYFKDFDYDRLPDDVHLLACAYALQEALGPNYSSFDAGLDIEPYSEVTWKEVTIKYPRTFKNTLD